MSSTPTPGSVMMISRQLRKSRRAAACTLVAAIALTGAAHGASMTNQDGEAHMLIVTERGVRGEVVIGAGETVALCPTGCFVTMPNGDRAVLRGSEQVDLISGAAIIR